MSDFTKDNPDAVRELRQRAEKAESGMNRQDARIEALSTLVKAFLVRADEAEDEYDKLRDAVVELFSDVINRHPEIREQGRFSCPNFQRLAEIIGYWR